MLWINKWVVPLVAPGGGLIELDFFVEAAGANGVQQSQRSDGVYVGRIFG